MEEKDILNKLEKIQDKINKTYESAEKTRQYFLWFMISTLLSFVLPLIALIFLLPKFISMYKDMLQF